MVTWKIELESRQKHLIGSSFMFEQSRKPTLNQRIRNIEYKNLVRIWTETEYGRMNQSDLASHFDR